jgi:TetR/AcrR family transcriptional regulator, transcriptional repressor for nem operon
MRRSREDTVETRRRIVEAASRLFRAKGIASVSVSDVMGSLGLTVGGFYRHFESKEALVAEAIQAASLETMAQHAPPGASIEKHASAILDAYLSLQHRAHAERGCPVAALCSEIGHETKPTREAFTKALERLIAAVDELAPRGQARRRKEVLRTAASMVGAVALARATTDEALAKELLDAVREGLKRSAKKA